MYMVGAHLVSKLTSMPYASFVESRIFAPLDMTASTFSPSKAARSGKLTETWTRGARRIPFWFSDEVAELFAGPGGVISSAEDMVSTLHIGTYSVDHDAHGSRRPDGSRFCSMAASIR